MDRASDKGLIICTLEYPYGAGEPWLKDELEELAKTNTQICLIPSKCGGVQRELPDNILLIKPLLDLPNQLVAILIFLVVAPLIFGYTIIYSSQRASYIKFWKSLLHYLWLDLSLLPTLLRIIVKLKNQSHVKQIIGYDHWMLNHGVSLSLLRKINFIERFICRAHGFDLYNEIHIEKVIPYREFIAESVDKILVISEKGMLYLKDKVRPHNHHKIVVSRLGIRPLYNKTVENLRTTPLEFLIVSCSRIDANKRVELIAEVLMHVKSNIHWVHFGDGVLKDVVLQKCLKLPKNIKYTLKGQVNNSYIHKFFFDNDVNLFISLSASEGIPVSMMEAQSFGVPIFATDVGGVNEIVTIGTGLLVKLSNLTIKEIAEKIDYVLTQHPFESVYIQNHFNHNFSIENNVSILNENLSLESLV